MVRCIATGCVTRKIEPRARRPPRPAPAPPAIHGGSNVHGYLCEVDLSDHYPQGEIGLPGTYAACGRPRVGKFDG